MSILILILAIFLVGVLGLMVWVWTLKQPKPPPRTYAHHEKYSDPKIKRGESVYLVDFSYSRAEGQPRCTKSWYAIRYVRESDGGYGEMGPWTPVDMPIIAGGSNLPCMGPRGYTSSCPFPTGKKSCTFNRPVLGTPTLSYNPMTEKNQNRIWANLHRQTGTFDPNSEGEAVAFLLPTASHGVKWMAADLFPPLDGGDCPGC